MAHQKEKKKINQNDLRRLMKERKENLSTEKNIESPLAKYDSTGRLSCIACNEIVKSSSLWRVHILGKTHKKNVTERLKRKNVEPILHNSKKVKADIFPKEPSNHSTISVDQKQPDPSKRLENLSSSSSSKLQNVGLMEECSSSSEDEDKNISNTFQSNTSQSSVSSHLPSDFFDSAVKPSDPPSSELQTPSSSMQITSDSKTNTNNQDLPEGFFDDPVLDAHARNIVYKDPLDEEMEKFQKEIAEATNLSQNLMDEDIEHSVTERNIEQIDEQMYYYSRVVAVQKKSEEIKVSISNKTNDNEPMEISSKSSDIEDEDQLLEELSDWRAKKMC